ncbi:pre-mRNA splicing factor SR-like 1 isoform X2 [Syzygium oleosum]|uniref:pre-mRNA splicing factor SR-like 1 isoform X2 n=1 Tax=Syzygium oleosum TaxID=219896 RepID=UPI0024B8BB89|nr:pre-mRNA splicing factor SR-like 1 isoform X2 [Syzygium oleosum]
MEIQTSGRPIDSLLEKVLCMNILSSDYFKELYRLKTYHEVIDEIYNQVDHVEPWMTGNCRGPSTAFCLLYKFFTMKLTVKQMHGLLKHPDSPYIRAIGFLYLRYAADPKTLWSWCEPYVKDEEEFSPGSNGRMTTMGVYLRDLLLGQYYFDTLFPRIPVPVLRQIVANLEKMKLPSKHSGVTGDTTRHGSEETARRPPSVKASLSVSFGQRAPHRASTRDSSPVRRTLPVPPYEKGGGDDLRRSPSRRSQSRDDREYSERDTQLDRDRDRDRDRERHRSERDRERERDRDHSRDRERERDRDHKRERDRDRDRARDTYRDRDRERDRERLRDRDRERDRRDSDRRSRYAERETRADYEKRSRDSRRSRSRSRSQSRSLSQSLRDGSAHLDRNHHSPLKDGVKEKTAASLNLAKLRDLYGDASDKKGGTTMERIPRGNSEGEEVIRLGGSTWK